MLRYTNQWMKIIFFYRTNANFKIINLKDLMNFYCWTIIYVENSFRFILNLRKSLPRYFTSKKNFIFFLLYFTHGKQAQQKKLPHPHSTSLILTTKRNRLRESEYAVKRKNYILIFLFPPFHAAIIIIVSWNWIPSDCTFVVAMCIHINMYTFCLLVVSLILVSCFVVGMLSCGGSERN